MSRAVMLVVMLQLLTGRGVVWDAPTIGLTMRDSDIVYTQVRGGQQLVGGETILRVDNASTQERAVVVAHVPDADEIPPEILEAEAAREDTRILGYSRDLDPQEVSASDAGGFGRITQSAFFHIHLRPDERYVIFDALSGRDGPVLWIQPGPEGDQASMAGS